jgi:hypothetical protein
METTICRIVIKTWNFHHFWNFENGASESDDLQA